MAFAVLTNEFPCHLNPKTQLDAVVSRLQQRLDQTIRQIAGPEGLATVVHVRELAQAAHTGRPAALPELTRTLEQLTEVERRVVARALSIFLDLMNVAEDRQRVRILRERERATHPAPRAESIRAAVAQLAAEGLSADDVQLLLDRLNIELVLTAHPTEAKRRSIRGKLRRLRELLQRLDERDLLPREAADLDAQLQAELTKLWQTDFIRPWPPTVIQEVQRGLSIMPVLWEVVPDVVKDLRHALAEFYPGQAFRVPPFLRFASWIGGDRDGHPGVTAEVTEQTLVWLRKAAVGQQRETVCNLFGSLSLSSRQAPVSEELHHAIATARRQLAGAGRPSRGHSAHRNVSPLVGDRGLASARVRPAASECAATSGSLRLQFRTGGRRADHSAELVGGRTTTCWCRARSSAGWIRSKSSGCNWRDWMCGRTPATTRR